MGGQLNLAQNSIETGSTNPLGLAADNSDFALQNIKGYAIARAGAVSLHGGYIFDLGDDTEYSTTASPSGAFLPTRIGNSDGRDAIFFGAGFEYPANFLRLFGGVDYFRLQSGGNNNPNTAGDESTMDGDDLINSMLGLGLRTSIFEIGAALQIQSRLGNPTTLGVGTAQGIGSSLATISPYARISPPRIPATLFIKTAVLNEYTESGIPIGGSNAIKPGATFGFTAGLTVGFQ